MCFEIMLVGFNREGAHGDVRSTVTYNFKIAEGSRQAHAEVMFTDGSRQFIEREGKNPREAARLALEKVLMTGRNPFQNPVLLRVSHKHAEYFAKHGSYHQSLRSECP